MQRQNLVDEMEMDRQKGEIHLGDQKQVYHCNFFNVFWQRTIERSSSMDGKEVIREAVRDYFYKTIESLNEKRDNTDAEEKASCLEEYFANVAAMGKVEIPHWYGENASITVENSHFAETWKNLFGEQDSPKCTYWEGALEAAVAFITGESLDNVKVQETECKAEGHDNCEFEVNFNG